MSLPQLQFQSNGQDIGSLFSQMQNLWATILNPIINRPQNKSTIIQNLVLASGDNIIPHTLNRALIGWSVVRQRASATFYDKQDTNGSPTVNLVLNASAAVTVDLEVF